MLRRGRPYRTDDRNEVGTTPPPARAVDLPGSRPIAASNCTTVAPSGGVLPTREVARKGPRRRERGEDGRGNGAGYATEARVRYAKTNAMGVVCYAMSEHSHRSWHAADSDRTARPSTEESS